MRGFAFQIIAALISSAQIGTLIQATLSKRAAKNAMVEAACANRAVNHVGGGEPRLVEKVDSLGEQLGRMERRLDRLDDTTTHVRADVASLKQAQAITDRAIVSLIATKETE